MLNELSREGVRANQDYTSYMCCNDCNYFEYDFLICNKLINRTKGDNLKDRQHSIMYFMFLLFEINVIQVCKV